MKIKGFRFFTAAVALIMMIGIFTPVSKVSAKTVKEGSKEYQKIENGTSWMIFQVIYNLFDGAEDLEKTSYKLTKDDYKTVFLSYLIDGNKSEYTKAELKQLSKDLFGKSYVDSDFLSNLTKKGKKYIVMLGDPGEVDYNSPNIEITKKKGYIYVTGDFYRIFPYSSDMPEELMGVMSFKFKQSGDNYVLAGAKYLPIN